MPAGLYSHRRTRPQRTTRRLMQPPQAPSGQVFARLLSVVLDAEFAFLEFAIPVNLQGPPVYDPGLQADGTGIPNGIGIAGLPELTVLGAVQTDPTHITVTFDADVSGGIVLMLAQPANWIRTKTGGWGYASQMAQ